MLSTFATTFMPAAKGNARTPLRPISGALTVLIWDVECLKINLHVRNDSCLTCNLNSTHDSVPVQLAVEMRHVLVFLGHSI